MGKEYRKNPELIEKENESGLLLFNVNSGVMVELNKTAKLLWKNTGDSFTLADLDNLISQNCYNIKNLDNDLNDFIKIAIKKNLIQDGKD